MRCARAWPVVLAMLAMPPASAQQAAASAPAVASAPAAASAPTLRLRRDDDEAPGALGKALLGIVLVAGAGVAVVALVRRRAGPLGAARPARLNAVAHLRLGPKCTLHLVEADGQVVLVTTGDAASLLRLGGSPAREGAP